MYLLIWLLVFLCYSVIISANKTLSESDLLTELFEDYKPDVRPRRNLSETVNVKLDIYIMSIDKIDEKRQTFTIRAFMEVTWRDDFLTWNPGKYGGVTTINVPNTKLWLPDLALLDVYDSLTDLGQKDGRAVVDNSGTVIIWPYKMYTVGCKIKIRRFPFDVQTCSLDFLSWTNSVSDLDINTSDELNLARYTENAEWAFENYEIIYYLMTFGNESWAHIKFVFELRRKWLFHVMNIIVPIVVISTLNVTCYLLPAACGEKITLCISIFLTLAVFLTIIASSMPESSDDISVLAVYVGLQLLGSALTILATVASLCLYNRDKSERVSGLLRLLCRLCCFNDKKQHIASKTENNVNVSGSCPETDITWETASRAFDRLCLWLTVCWQIVLFIGFMIGLSR